MREVKYRGEILAPCEEAGEEMVGGKELGVGVEVKAGAGTGAEAEARRGAGARTPAPRGFPSLLRWACKYDEDSAREGERIERTVDLHTTAGYALLLHPQRAVVEADYARLVRLQLADMFSVEEEGIEERGEEGEAEGGAERGG